MRESKYEILPPKPLTNREKEVIRLMMEGVKSLEIAGKLGITRNTVLQHYTHVREKLGTKNKKETFEALCGKDNLRN